MSVLTYVVIALCTFVGAANLIRRLIGFIESLGTPTDDPTEPAIYRPTTAQYVAAPQFDDTEFTVDSGNGTPDVAQFAARLPDHLDNYQFTYTSGGYLFAFTATRLRSTRYDVLIRQSPPYNNRTSTGAATHRHDVGTPRERICFARGAEPHTLPEACRIACLWADLTIAYIQTGAPWE